MMFYKDLKLTRRTFDQMTSDREFVNLTSTSGGDLRTVEGHENLMQAIINRLLTRQGELTKFGHPNYGSRLYELIGELNNLRLRAKAEVFIRNCLAQEPRIEEVRYVNFEPPSRSLGRSELRATIGIKPIGSESNLTIILPISI